MKRNKNKDSTSSFISDNRAQNLQDFAIGASILLITVAFVGLFLPNLFVPFESSDAGDSIKSERVAESLVTTTLQDDSLENREKSTIDREATIAFFALNDESVTVDSEIYDNTNFDESEELHEMLGVRETRDNVYVKIKKSGSEGVASIDYYSSGDDVDSTPQEINLEIGDTPPESQNTGTKDRIVYMEGKLYEMTVKVW